jgi:uncharacterized protein YecT (DUF1311 family)
MACRNALAYANDFWDDDFVYKTKEIEYIAFYDATERQLTAQIVLESLTSGACEVRIKLSENQKEFGDGVEVIANLSLEDSVGREWIKSTRAPRVVYLPNYAVANPNLRLTELPQKWGSTTTNPRSLATVSSPPWCAQLNQAKLDEKATCASARLSAFDVLMERYFRELISKATPSRRTAVQSEQRLWFEKRRQCGGEQDCLERAYVSRIGNLTEELRSLD